VKQEQEEDSKPIDWLNIGLWAVKFAVLFTSARHVAEAFLSLENAGTHAFWGWLPALATDGGLLFMAWKLKSDSKSKILWGGFIWFLVMSAFAQIDHAIQNVNFTGDWLYDGWTVVKIGLFAFSLPFLVAFMVVVASKRHAATEPQPEPSTALTTTTRHRQPATDNPQTKVKVRRRDNRIAATKAPAALPDNLPTMPRLQPTTPTQNAQPQPTTYGQVDDFSDNHHHNYNPPPTTEVEELQLVEVVEQVVSQDALNAVRWLQQGVSIAKIAKQQGVSSEGVRKRLRVAYLADPRDVTERIPGWVADNEKFLSEKK